MPAKAAIFVALAGFTLSYAAVFVASLRRIQCRGDSPAPVPPIPVRWPPASSRISSTRWASARSLPPLPFSSSDAWFPTELIPGTLNAGHTLPVIFQAFIYIAAIEVDVTTLVLMIASAQSAPGSAQGWCARLSRRTVQFAMGAALLLIAAVAMLVRQFDLFPLAANRFGLWAGGWLQECRAILSLAQSVLWAIGFYAPCMTLVSLLGMNPAAAFPIMMGSRRFLMPVASIRFCVERGLLCAGRRGPGNWRTPGSAAGRLCGQIAAADTRCAGW